MHVYMHMYVFVCMLGFLFFMIVCVLGCPIDVVFVCAPFLSVLVCTLVFVCLCVC